MHDNNNNQIQNSISSGERAGKWDQEGRGIQGTLFIFLIVFKIFIF